MQEQSATKRGALIVLEGIDRTGKTEQVCLLSANLRNKMNIKTRMISFPRRAGEIGKLIHQYLKKEIELSDEAVHLLFTSDRWNTCEEIREELTKGITVIIDRYTYSGLAYSLAKGLDFDWCLNGERGLPKPDLIFYLDIPLDKNIYKQIYYKENREIERYKTYAFQRKLRETFESLMQHEEIGQHNWYYVNGFRCMVKVGMEIFEMVKRYIRLNEDRFNNDFNNAEQDEKIDIRDHLTMRDVI